MATPSAASPYSPTPVSPTFPTDVTSTPPSHPAPAERERRSSQKRVAASGAARYPSPPLALAPAPPQAAPPAAARSYATYDPSLVIPPFNPNKRRSAGAAPPQPSAGSSASSRRNSAQPERAAPTAMTTHAMNDAQYAQQQQQLYAQQYAQMQLQLQQQQPQQHQRPVSVMPGYPSARTPSAAEQAAQYAAYYGGAQAAPAPPGPGGSVSSRARQSVGCLPPSASAASLAGQGPYPHLYTPHPLPRQKVYFGPYVLLQTLGEGEFGKVKLGVHGERWGEDVAIKLIKRGNVDTAQRGEKVRREIEVLKMVRHPNIVRLYDVIETEKYIGIVLEYASGGELFDHILAHRYLKERDASRLFAQLISGVAYLHAKGVVHRDLKLENLLLDRNRNVIITDFGFANRFNEARVDLMATSCGSPCYAAPELVVSDGKYVGTAVDVWSCGVILYAMLAGYLPYDDDPNNPEGDNINLLYRYILNTPLSFPDWITDEPRELLLLMLVPDPLRRCTIADVTRHSWLRRYAPAFEKTVAELEYQAQEMERHKRQALEIQRQWLVAQQQQQALAAQGLLAPSMTRSQTATTAMGGSAVGGPGPGPLSASMGPAAAIGSQQLQPLSVAQQRHRSAMVTSASTALVSAPLAQHGFEQYSIAPPSPAPVLVAPLSPSSPTVPEPPVSPRTRTSSSSTTTGVITVPHSPSSNPNRRSGAYTVSSSPPTTHTEFASANAGPFSFAAAAGGAGSVPMAPSLSAPAAPSSFSSARPSLELPTLTEDAVMHDRTPSPASTSTRTGSAPVSRAGSTRRAGGSSDDERRRKAAHRATVQVEYDGGISAVRPRRGVSREPSLATAAEGEVRVDGLGIVAPAPGPAPPLPSASAPAPAPADELQRPGAMLDVPPAVAAPSPTPSLGAVSISTTTETAPSEDVVMQSVEEAVPDDEALPPPVPAPVPFPAAAVEPAETPASPPRKRKSSGSPPSSVRPPAELPPPPAAASEEEAQEVLAAPTERQQPKTSAGSQTSQLPPRPPSAASTAGRHRHTASADRFSLRSLLGASNPPAASRPPASTASATATSIATPPPVPTKDTPFDEVTNRRKAGRRQKAMSLQPFRQSVSAKLPKGARANVDAAVAHSRDRATAVNVQGEMLPPVPKQPSRAASTSRPDPAATASLATKRFSADLEANWGPAAPTAAPGPTPSGKAKAVMDWFRRKSSRADGAAPAAPAPAPIRTDFDRVPAARPPPAPPATPAAPPARAPRLRAPLAPRPHAPHPARIVTQPAPLAPQQQQREQLESAPPSNGHSQISYKTASTLGSSVGSTTGLPLAPAPAAAPQVGPPAAFTPSKLRFHQGALDKNAITYRAPNEVLGDIKQALWNMGVDMAMEGEYKIKCVRKSRKKAMASSVGQTGGASAGLASSVVVSPSPLDRRSSLVASPSLPQSPSMGFRSLFGKKVGGAATPLGSPSLTTSPNFSVPGTPSTQDHFDPLSSPMTTSVSQFSMLSLSSPQPLPVYGGDKSADAGDEVRFVVELTRVKNLDRMYCVDMKRMKGMAWSYKHVYDQLLGSLELGPSV
ncbi:hypothetical protein JCM3770_005644 [Rhodotorula araucariae]